MSDMENVANLLVETNKKLDKLHTDNLQDDTARSIVANSLPEVLSDQQLAGRRERFDKKEEIVLVDDRVVDNTKAVVDNTKADKKNADNIVNAITGKKDEDEIVDDKKTKGFFGRISTMILPKKDKEGKAGKKEEEDEKNSLSKKTFALLKLIGSGIGTLVKFATDKVKTVGKGIFAFLSALGLGAFLIALGLFLQSDEWPKLIKTLKKWDKKLKEFGVGLGEIAAGLAAAAALVLFAPGRLFFRLLGGVAFGLIGKALFGLGKGLGSLYKGITGATSKIPGAFFSGEKLGTIYSQAQGKKVSVGVGPSGNLFELGADGKPTAVKVDPNKVNFDRGGEKRLKAIQKFMLGGGQAMTKPASNTEMLDDIAKSAKGTKFLKFLMPILRAAPWIMATMAGFQLYDTWTNPLATRDDKMRATAGVLGGFAGSAAALTAAAPLLAGLATTGIFTGGIGTLGAAAIAGVIGAGGFVGGHYFGNEVADWLLGGNKPDVPTKEPTTQGSLGTGSLLSRPGTTREDNRMMKQRSFRGTARGANLPGDPPMKPKVGPVTPMKTNPLATRPGDYTGADGVEDMSTGMFVRPGKPQASNTIIAPTNNVANTTFNGSGTTSLARNKYFGLNGPEAQGFFA